MMLVQSLHMHALTPFDTNEMHTHKHSITGHKNGDDEREEEARGYTDEGTELLTALGEREGGLSKEEHGFD
jgi:hypothetical protein